MKQFQFGLLLALVVGASAQGVELKYKFKVGEVLKYQYSNHSTIQVKLNQGGGDDPFGGFGDLMKQALPENDGVVVDLIETLEMVTTKTYADGSADIDLRVSNLKLSIGGQLVSTIADLPKDAQTAKAHVDARGNMTFYKLVTVVIRENIPYIFVTEESTGITYQSQNQSLKVTASYQALNIGYKQVTSTVSFEQEDSAIDTAPKELASMLELPTEDIKTGQTGFIKVPGFDAHISYGVQSLDAKTGVAKILMEFDVDSSADDFVDRDPKDIPMGPEDLSLRITGTVTYVFDSKNGKLISIESPELFQSAGIDMMGISMSIQTTSKVALKRIN